MVCSLIDCALWHSSGVPLRDDPGETAWTDRFLERFAVETVLHGRHKRNRPRKAFKIPRFLTVGRSAIGS